MKKLATIALTVAALSLAFSLASCSSGSGGGSDDDAASLVAGGSGSGSGSVSGGTPFTDGAVQGLSYSSDELNNKVFSYEDDGTRYLGFTGGKCYKSSDPSSFQSSKEKDYTILKYDGQLYRSGACIRTSGTGLVGTFSDGEATFTFANGGSGTFNIEGETGSFTYTNNDGELTLTIPGEGNAKMYYNGSNKIYYVDDEARLTFVQEGVTVN
ncbi:MAG TPA: hypothetical protein DCP61_07610 [Treponema sp.]|nr:hypothetical protein [Treponema sp.]